MRKWGLFTIALLLGVMLMSVETRASIPQMWTDQIVTLGTVKRAYFHLLYENEAGTRWLYFGTTAAEKPPTTGDPVIEYAYVQFPVGFDDLGPDMEGMMFDHALAAGKAREGISEQGVTELWTDLYEESGLARVFSFHLKSEGTWYYFGSDPATYPPTSGGTIIEIANVQFPRDFDEFGDESNDMVYDLALISGLRREGWE
jgi:hypothetical protein